MSSTDHPNSEPLILTKLPVAAASGGLRPMLAHMTGNVWIVIDMLLAVAGITIAYWANPFLTGAVSGRLHLDPSWHTIVFLLGIIVAAHVFGLHDPLEERDPRGLMLKLLFVVVLASTVVIAVAMFVFFERVGRHLLVTSAASTWMLMLGSRLVFWKLTKQNRQRIGLLGGPDFYASAEAFFRSHPRPIELEPPPPGDVELGNWAIDRRLDEVVVHGRAPLSVQQQLLECLDRGIPVLSYSEFLERHYRCVPVAEIDSRWFLDAAMDGLHPYYRATKRLTDITVGVLGLVLSAPLILLAAIAIRLESPGPIFYSQLRVGLHNRRFRIYKLRTMRNDAEKSGEAQWAKKCDARVTLIGKILRKTRIDEVPQFWNILRGDMAFIGPRPERPEFTENLAKEISFYEKRHMVKPGLTGWAQINYSYGASVQDARNKLTFDLYYVKYASLELDLHILVRTVGAIMKGAR